MTTDGESDVQALNEEARAAWDRNAAYWDERMGEGNAFHTLLVRPAAERLLEIKPGERVLEIGCGNGLFARRLAELGARVLATDFSAELIERARARTRANADRIEYQQVDATDTGQLLALGEHEFDAIVSNMALMDMAEVDPLMNAVPRLLKPRGRFVFTIMHPCFNSMGTALMAEEEDCEGELVLTFSAKVSRYASLGVRRGLALVGQPVPQLYFHRTLAELFGAAFRAGLLIDGLEEPTFNEETKGSRTVSWADFHDIPPVLAARLRSRV